MIKNAFLLVLVALLCFPLLAQKVNEPQGSNPEWSQAYPPFRIVGNLYYVGTYDLACYLVVTPKGNMLINTGLAASASLIKENVETLGFKFNDIKILLTTQVHYDHVAAMAAIKKQTDAKMMVDDKDAPALADGGASDYALGKEGSNFEPVKADRLLKDGDEIALGNIKLTMLHHPGHTKGSCSFLLDVKDENKTYKVLIANMPSIVTSEKFSEIASYPDITKDYAYTLESLKKQSFDLWLSSHASQFGLHAKHKPGDGYNPEAFRDRVGYDKVVNDLEIQYKKKIDVK